MIGRHADLSIYREIFRSEDFIKASFGAFLIPLSFLLPKAQLALSINLGLLDIALLLSIAVNGLPIIVEAVKGVLNKEINVDELVSIAIIACVLNGNYLEGAVVSAIMVFGALVEEAVSDGARNAIRKLVEITPKTTMVEKDGKEIEVDIKKVLVGNIVVLKAGDTIGVDGTVIEGSTSVDESSITGESIPVQKTSGDQVFAGTLCTNGFIRIRADKVGKDSTIGRIIQLVEGAEQQKTRSGKIVDTYAAWFTPVILSVAALTYLLTGDITRAITVLIVGCPCSFLLASPVTTVAAIGRAAKAGIVVKGGKYLENIADSRFPLLKA
jgi:Zn2+/Cd2+-exporting ATPase